MKIKPVLFQHIKNLSQSKQQKPILVQNPFQEDVFVKKANQKNLKTFDSQYDLLKSEIDEYFSKEENVNFEEIKNILKKHFPNIEIQISPADANSYLNLKFDNDLLIKKRFGKLKAQTYNQKIEVETFPFINPQTKELLKISILHECIHALQDNSLDRITQADFISSLAKKYPNLTSEDIQKTFDAFNGIVNMMSQKAFNYLGFEDTGTKGSIDDFAKFQTKLKNMEKFKFDDATKDIGMSGEEAAQRLIEIFIKKISIKNPKFLCEYFIFHAQKELEAYQKAMPDNVNIISDSIRSNNFIEIDIHKTIIKAAKRLLEKLK